MEKRWSERKSLCVSVDIYQQGQLLGVGSSRDIGLGGAFLGVESPLNLQHNADVDLVFRLISGEESVRHRISARIARLSEQGVGLKFCDFDTGVFRSLQEIMAYRED